MSHPKKKKKKNEILTDGGSVARGGGGVGGEQWSFVRCPPLPKHKSVGESRMHREVIRMRRGRGYLYDRPNNFFSLRLALAQPLPQTHRYRWHLYRNVFWPPVSYIPIYLPLKIIEISSRYLSSAYHNIILGTTISTYV